jgi:hypothetical protein
MKKCAEFMQNQRISMDVLQAVAEDSIFENRLLWTFRAARTRAELLHRKGICDLVAIVDIAQAIMAPQTMLDFFPKLVIIKHRLVPCEEYQASNVFDRASFITKFNLCEDLRVPEREVFIDVFKAAKVQKSLHSKKQGKNPHARGILAPCGGLLRRKGEFW